MRGRPSDDQSIGNPFLKIPGSDRLRTLPDGDPDTAALLAAGETFGVFQLESSGMRRYVRGVQDFAVAGREMDVNLGIASLAATELGLVTIMYTAHYPRLHPSDFKVKTLDGVAEAWPVDYETLEPFFAENDRMMGVSGLPGDPGVPPRHPPMPPVPMKPRVFMIVLP